MKASALEVLAAPLLIAQGLWVRAITPKLPEAAGAREGLHPVESTAGPRIRGDELRLLIVGDSSAAGVGAADQRQALAGRLAAALADRSGKALRWRLIARTGVNARELERMIARTEPGSFDIALIVVGVNDVTGMRGARRWIGDIDALAKRLRDIAPGALLVASGLPPMHRFPALPRPLRGVLGARAFALDAALADWALRQPDALHAPIPDIDDPSLAASDGFHPGPGAYALWADTLARAIVDQVPAPALRK